jgi:hypothetical protein
MKFEACVADTEKALQALSEVLGLRYRAGDFSLFEDEFVQSGKVEDFFTVSGEGLLVSVHLEKYEGYFFIAVSGDGAAFENAKELLSLGNY